MPDPIKVRRGRNSKARGKSVEREVAKLVGGKRIPDGVGYGDVQNTTSIYEVKSRQQPTPKLISGAWEQALRAAEATSKDPYVVISYKDGPQRTYWLVQRIERP